jgi:acyl-CoA synthetase (AMP-forming)/AMP-acid ligase II
VPGLHLRIIRAVDGPVELGPAGWRECDVSPGDAGEVVVAGEHVVGEYLHASEETRRHKIRDGERVWHRTGDGGRVGDDGRLWLLGRISTRVVREGETWWSMTAELNALAVPGVRHAAYFGVPDELLGQRAVLCVEVDSGDLGSDPEGRLRAALEPMPVDQIHLLRRIPRDPRHASKTDMEALRKRVAGTRE